MVIRLLPVLLLMFMSAGHVVPQNQPPIEPGVSHELAKWRAARYSDVRYKLILTLEKMSPVLKGTMEIRVKVAQAEGSVGVPIVLDWRKIKGSEPLSTISNVQLNGLPYARAMPNRIVVDGLDLTYGEHDEHLIFGDGVVAGENVIKLDFTSPILTSGSAITRYVDKEDGSEYIYSLFVPSDASTAFPVFDQPDLKGRFSLTITGPSDWRVVSNASIGLIPHPIHPEPPIRTDSFFTTKPISTYVFAFAAGPWEGFGDTIDPYPLPVTSINTERGIINLRPTVDYPATREDIPNISDRGGAPRIYVRKSQAAKFQPHAAEVFRLNREAIKHLETYFDYKFPFPKYDLVLIPEFPFGGMEHAGATFLRESSIIFPTEPTKGDYISRANLIFHEAAHQWFGDTVTMRWFDDLWLKEGFAEFMAYKTLEKVMPDANAWKVFYERNKQAAYQTDSTRGTTPIYQPIKNLSAAKSAYGNIVYRKAPSFLKQAEFYLGADNFQKAVRTFLKKNEFGNAGWEDLVKEFEGASGDKLREWAAQWVTQPGMPVFRTFRSREVPAYSVGVSSKSAMETRFLWSEKVRLFLRTIKGERPVDMLVESSVWNVRSASVGIGGEAGDFLLLAMPNYQDYGYGIFLLDDKSREYVLKNIQNEKDPFLRSMMWGALWDSVREAELDPRVYVELAIRQLGGQVAEARVSARAVRDRRSLEDDETIVASLLGRMSTALNYYLPASDTALANARASATSNLRSRFETMLLDRLQNAPTPGQRVTFFRAFVNNASTAQSRVVLKDMLRQSSSTSALRGGLPPANRAAATGDRAPSGGSPTPNGGSPGLKPKDRFDIVTRLAVLNDPDAPRLLADLERTETTDEAKRYAYIARAAFPTAENKTKFWNDFVGNKDLSESWIEGAVVPFNSIRHAALTQPYLQKALTELPTLKRTRKIFFINNWLSAWLSGQRDQAALDIVNKFLADNPQLDNDLRLKVLENLDIVERAVRIRSRFSH
jgi:aminopeptidase N